MQLLFVTALQGPDVNNPRRNRGMEAPPAASPEEPAPYNGGLNILSQASYSAPSGLHVYRVIFTPGEPGVIHIKLFQSFLILMYDRDVQ